VSGAGAGSENDIFTATEALIQDSSTVSTSNATDVSVKARQVPTITADAGGLSIGVSLASASKGSSVTVGAAAAVNNIGDSSHPDKVLASIDSSTVTSDGAVDVEATAGDATRTQILAIAVGIAGALVGGRNAGLDFAGAGAGSGNTVDEDVEASI